MLSPRWYIAARAGLTSAKAAGNQHTLEGAAGFRPNRFQLIKAGYELEHYSTGDNRNDNTFAVQIVTSLTSPPGAIEPIPTTARPMPSAASIRRSILH